MKLDFRVLPCRNIEGEAEPRDVSKELGNVIYRETSDLGELDMAQRIYRDGCVELDEGQLEAVRGYVRRNFRAFVQRALEEMIDGAGV